MKKLIVSMLFYSVFQIVLLAQTSTTQIEGKEVYRSNDVVFRQLDEHTWIGTGNRMFNESLYLLEGNDRAMLIDAGTEIADLDKIVASITTKPVTLVATHVHPDHTGAAIKYFHAIYINEADTLGITQFMPGYKGKVKFLKDGESIDLGGREVEVVFTPAHTPGSTTFIDKKNKYGFSGDSFGSGYLLLGGNFSTLIATCTKMENMINQYGIKCLYPGHYMGKNPETPQRIKDLTTISKDILSGKIKGETNPRSMMGLDLIVTDYGVSICYNSQKIK